MIWLLWLALLALAACYVFLRHLKRDRSHQKEMLQRLMSSRIYLGVHMMLQKVPHAYIERITIQPEMVVVMQLDGREYRYEFERHDADPIRPDTLLTFAQAIAVDVPEVQDAAYYTFKRFDTYTPAGDKLPSYAYILKPSRKNYLLRAMKTKGHL